MPALGGSCCPEAASAAGAAGFNPSLSLFLMSSLEGNTSWLLKFLGYANAGGVTRVAQQPGLFEHMLWFGGARRQAPGNQAASTAGCAGTPGLRALRLGRAEAALRVAEAGEDPAWGLSLESRSNLMCLCLGKDAREQGGIWDRVMETS